MFFGLPAHRDQNTLHRLYGNVNINCNQVILCGIVLAI